MNIYSALYNDDAHLSAAFNSSFETVSNVQACNKPGLLILHGGSDIHPSLYGEENIASHVQKAPSSRDETEVELATHFLKNGWPVFGICRGMQLLTALLGGKLIQDVSNHAGGKHLMRTNTDIVLQVNSAHHQMCVLDNTDHVLTGWAEDVQSHKYIGGSKPSHEPEAVWWKQHNAYGVQWHPEWLSKDSAAVLWVLSELKTKLKRV